MKIQRFTQFKKSAGSSIYLGYSISYIDREEPKFKDVSSNRTEVARGWDKDRWLTLCNNFRLEFIYG
jgi:hypothetical protein